MRGNRRLSTLASCVAALLGGAAAVCACGFTGAATLDGDLPGADARPADAMASDGRDTLDGATPDAPRPPDGSVDAGVAGDASPSGPVACHGLQDCAGIGVCCGFIAPAPGSACLPTCAGGGVEVCDPNAVDSGCGADMCSAKTASDWGAPAGTGTCGGQCPGGC